MASTSDTPIDTEKPKTRSRQRANQSIVWDHFIVDRMPNGNTRAVCQSCNGTFAYYTGTKFSGSSHLKRHILRSCPALHHHQQEKNRQLSQISTPKTPSKRKRCPGSNFSDGFEQETSTVHLASMIILHEYPLNIVEFPSFIAFTQQIQPQFRLPSTSTIEAKIIALHSKERQNVTVMLGNAPGRVCLSISAWSTSQTLGYVSLTGHFIDDDWRLHRRMLNFKMVSSPHSGNFISDMIVFCLSEWNVKTSKLGAVTLDSTDWWSHDICGENLKYNLMLKSQLFIPGNYGQILKVVAQDLIASIHGIVCTVRGSVKYVKASVACEERFMKIVRQLQIAATSNISLDVHGQWNTTYLMLSGALEYRQAFSCLEACNDNNYRDAPSADDWRKVEIVCTYLKSLCDSAHVLMSRSDSLTSNIFFHEASKLQLELKSASSSEDPMVIPIAREIQGKFDSYWNGSFLALSIAVIMDPRFKMKLVKFFFGKIYGDDAAAASYIKTVSDSLQRLYYEYVDDQLLIPSYVDDDYQQEECVVDPTGAIDGLQFDNVISENVEEINLESLVGIVDDDDAWSSSSSNVQFSMAEIPPNDDCLLDFDIYISELGVPQLAQSELERYLDEPLVSRIQEFDILYWWRLNTLKYPILSKMARDVLSIPMLTMSPHTIFSSGTDAAGIVSDYHSQLRPETVEAIYCAKDWLQYSKIEDCDRTAKPSHPSSSN